MDKVYLVFGEEKFEGDYFLESFESKDDAEEYVRDLESGVVKLSSSYDGYFVLESVVRKS